MTILRLLAVVTFFYGVDARAVWDDYSPFEKGQELPAVVLTAFTVTKSAAVPRESVVLKSYQLVDKAKKTVRIDVAWPGKCEPLLTLSVDGEKQFSGLIVASPITDVEVYGADLNGDGVADYAVYNDSGGCGLAGQLKYVTLLLSSPTGYGCVRVMSYDAKPADFVNISSQTYLVHTSFISGEEGKDGRHHNYWVYNLLKISGKTLVLDNTPDRRFPKWVMYSFDPNHRDTTQLTTEQRQRLWTKYRKENPGDTGGD